MVGHMGGQWGSQSTVSGGATAIGHFHIIIAGHLGSRHTHTASAVQCSGHLIIIQTILHGGMECNNRGSPGHKIISKNENAQACAPVTPENTKQIVGDISFYHLTFQLLSGSRVSGAS